MQDYEAIDISDYCNTGAAILGDLAEDVETCLLYTSDAADE